MSDPVPTAPDTTKSSHRPAQFGLIALVLFSIVPPLLYYRAIDPFLDSTRINGGLLPGPFLLLRLSAHASAFVAVALLLLTIFAFVRPISARSLLYRGTVLLLVFSIAYLCYTLFMIAVMFAVRDI